MRDLTDKDVSRFMEKVECQENGCWRWTASIQCATGYGRFGIGHDVTYAHRAAWLLFRGAIPCGIEVCHTCDVRECVNPDHLFLGTRADNMRDASRKGRIVLPARSFASDETHQPAKLTNAQVRHIRESNRSLDALAAMYGVHRCTVWQARTRRTFRDVA